MNKINKNVLFSIVIFIFIIGVGFFYLLKNRSIEELAAELPQPPVAPSILEEVPVNNQSTLTSPVFSDQSNTSSQSFASELNTSSIAGENAERSVVIKISDQGFDPKEVEINKGTRITWVNESSKPSWPASDVHPTHRIYPGSGIEKCGTGEEIFDACRGLQKGESWSFVFNEVGEWSYHDHLNPSKTGKIIVK